MLTSIRMQLGQSLELESNVTLYVEITDGHVIEDLLRMHGQIKLAPAWPIARTYSNKYSFSNVTNKCQFITSTLDLQMVEYN